ncbi:MAG TPA: ketoacyl-ACP synthase III [Gemmatimonadaceae bacterium]|nr:ketoacyl-ACP synthase III [Gemmatimonadaceae bacterium]
MKARIAGTGHYLPGAPVTNDELIERHGLRVKSYFIRNHIGVETRHFASAEQATSDLAAEAARRAIATSGVAPREIRRIILATVSGDYPTPATACVVQRKLGLSGCGAIDVVGACAGFVQALDLGARCVETGESPVLVIGADVRSRQLNFSDLRTAFLYGDGAGAVVLTAAENGDGIRHSILTADGEGAEAVYIPGGGSREPLTDTGLRNQRNRITMPDGQRVAVAARAGFRQLAARMIAETEVDASEIGFVCLHQPNLFLVRQILDDLGVAESRSWINFPTCANTTSASVPIALSQAVAAGRVHDGEWVWLGAVGAGFSGGMQLVRWAGAAA